MVALAAAAAGGWLLALAGVVPALRDANACHDARVRVIAGIGLTVLGAAAVLALAPEAASASTVLLTAGIAVGLCYLLLLRRLPEHRRHA